MIKCFSVSTGRVQWILEVKTMKKKILCPSELMCFLFCCLPTNYSIALYSVHSMSQWTRIYRTNVYFFIAVSKLFLSHFILTVTPCVSQAIYLWIKINNTKGIIYFLKIISNCSHPVIEWDKDFYSKNL
jgi:hypothetical protein